MDLQINTVQDKVIAMGCEFGAITNNCRYRNQKNNMLCLS